MVRTNARTCGRVDVGSPDYQNFADALIIKFSYPWRAAIKCFILISFGLILQLSGVMSLGFLRIRMIFSQGHGTSYSKIFAIDMHAPSKGVKFRSQSSPWINNDIRRNMKLRFKLFKRAFSTKDQEIYARYKKVRDGITPEIRNAKAQYFKDKLAEVKTAVVY